MRSMTMLTNRSGGEMAITVRARRRGRLGLAAVLLLLGAGRSGAAVVTVTDCANDPHIHILQQRTIIDADGADLVLKCSLTPVKNTTTLQLLGANITIAGPEGQLHAPGQPPLAITMTTPGTFTMTGGGMVEATSGNASIDVSAGAGIVLSTANLTVGGVAPARPVGAQPGADIISLVCTGPACKITAFNTTLRSRLMTLQSMGDIDFDTVMVQTFGPRDKVVISSKGGHFHAPGCANKFLSGTDGLLMLDAFGDVDLSFAKVVIGQDILISSGTGAPPLRAVNLNGAVLRNDFGKSGRRITVTAGGQKQISICGTTLVNDGPQVATLNGRSILPHEGFANVFGTPDVDN